METFDYKKAYKDLYILKTKPMMIQVPSMNFVMVKGNGNPNEPDGAYANALQILYGISYTIKMSKKNLLKCLLSISEDEYSPRYHFFLLLKS